MKIGFTGTREGMSVYQKAWFYYHFANQPLSLFEFNEFHHGDCIGADAEAHDIVDTIRQSVPIKILTHPGNRPEWRANKPADKVFAPKDTLARNLDIVRAVDLLIACPKTVNEIKHSGTWTTIRRARDVKTPIIIVKEGLPNLRTKR